MKKIIYALMLVFLISTSACEKWLDRNPTEILLEDQVWNDPTMAVAVLANLYNRLQPFGGLSDGFLAPTDVDEAMWSGGLGENNARNTRVNYAYSFRQLWDYALIRDINIFLEKVESAEKFDAEVKKQLLAEGRFVRAYVYFLHVASMGGVPLVLKPYTYQVGDDVSLNRLPRSTEAGLYDFILTELDEIKDDLDATTTSKTRANKWTALALKSRASLYAASIAKYNAEMANPIVTPGGEVGIPAANAKVYYEKSLLAAKEIIESGNYSLYNINPDKAENFYDLFTKKQGNPEVIWAQDYTLDGKYHSYTVNNIPRSLREDVNGAAGVTPSLNLVEAFDYLDGSSGELKINDGGEYVYYDHPEDLFAQKDPRLWASVIYPGSVFRGQKIAIQAGVLEWNSGKQAYDVRTSTVLGSAYNDGGVLIGADGPLSNYANVTNTGFYTRKYLDSRIGSAQGGQGTDVWWIRFRFGEILLNAAEAAFELGNQQDALSYINQLRERAGFETNSLNSLTTAKIRQERQVELAFEEHRLWDLKRWRRAHQIFNGNRQLPSTMVYALLPYRVIRPNDPSKHNKYVFMKKIASRFTQPRNFRIGNYYANIPQNAIDANPLLVKNPFH